MVSPVRKLGYDTLRFHIRCRRLGVSLQQQNRNYAAVLSDSSLLNRAPSAGPSASRENDFFDPNTNTPIENAGKGKRSSRTEKADSIEGMRASLVTQVKCSIFDTMGNIRHINRVFPKAAFCSEHGLAQRDLRKIDSAIPQAVPTILVRKKCILVNIQHIRALVKSDGVYLFDCPGSSNARLQATFIQHLHQHLQQNADESPLAFEHRVLEIILASVSTVLERESRDIQHSVEEVLTALESAIVPNKLRELLALSKRLSEIQRRAKLTQTALDDVLSQDEDLDGLYLTSPRSLDLGTDHQEVEMLLETYSSQIEEIANSLDILMSNVDQTKEVTELILDSSRNSLIALDLKVSIGTMALGSGAFVAALLGMNLSTGLETHPHAFATVTGISGALAGMVGLYALKKMRALRAISLSAKHARYTAGPSQQSEWARRRIESHIARLHRLDEQIMRPNSRHEVVSPINDDKSKDNKSLKHMLRHGRGAT